jgi:hypothetical protein
LEVLELWKLVPTWGIGWKTYTLSLVPSYHSIFFLSLLNYLLYWITGSSHLHPSTGLLFMLFIEWNIFVQ